MFVKKHPKKSSWKTSRQSWPLEDKLAQEELGLATQNADLQDFNRRYLRIVGVKLAELDELEAQIDERLARLHPKDQKAKENATRSRVRAQESASAASLASEEKIGKPFKPSEDLKHLYRELAKKIHPDLSPNEEVREVRHRFMQEINQAYAKGDAQRLQEILARWENSPESVAGEGIAIDLVRVIRKIAHIRERLVAIQKEIDDLKNSDLYALKKNVDEATGEGRDLLAEMADEMDEQIDVVKTHLRKLKFKSQ